MKAGEKCPFYIDWVESETNKGLVSGGVQYHNSRESCELFSRNHAIFRELRITAVLCYLCLFNIKCWIHSTSFIVGAKFKQSETASRSDNVNIFKDIPFMLSRSQLLKCPLIQAHL